MRNDLPTFTMFLEFVIGTYHRTNYRTFDNLLITILKYVILKTVLL